MEKTLLWGWKHSLVVTQTVVACVVFAKLLFFAQAPDHPEGAHLCSRCDQQTTREKAHVQEGRGWWEHV